MPAAGSATIFDTLMAAAPDEPAREYGLVAESVEVAPDQQLGRSTRCARRRASTTARR